MKIYLAGPDVFLPDALAIGQRKQDICSRHGLTGLYPLDNAIDLAARDCSLHIFKGNEAMMDAADAIIANLTPFRGPGADPGTVYELGYMIGRGKPCFAYSNDPSIYVERVARFTKVTASSDNRLVDPDGLTVEDFGLSDNLMMIHALDLHGRPLLLPRKRPDDIWHDLTAFEECVRLAAGKPG
ncbi:nucleoside 2-deoxyribosyltransferase [Bradyrhizobium sp.]|uniref:nucleoside 2-deoxyribosyltransferase n=1 Tax=Bradyrhizobium sp. TaxID=376 RepID=UPI0040383CF7